MTALSAETTKSAQSAETAKNTRKAISLEYLSLSHIVKILNEEYHFPISYHTLAKYMCKGVFTPDYVLERRFLFHKDRVPEIENTLKNKFHEKLSQSIQKRSQNKSENKTNEKATDNSIIELLLFFEAKNLKWRRTYFVTSCWICAKVEKCHFFKILTQNKE